MHAKTRFLSVAVLLFAAAISSHGQQPAQEEFVSVLGRFGIMLPTNYAEFKTNLDLTVGENKFYGAMYRWALASDQAVISYATGSLDLEAKADVYLPAFRDDYIKKTTQGSVIGEKKTSLAGHPGLIFVVDSSVGRTMAWTYLIRNRFYLMSLTLNDAAKTEEHVKLLSTFRLLTRKDLEPRYAQLISELTPTPLAPEAAIDRPTTDAQDVALKGKVKQVVTESERYFGDVLFDDRDVLSVEDFDERGNLTRSVQYAGDLPRAVRAYGYKKGERVFREMRRLPNIVLASDSKDRKDHITKAPEPEAKDFKIKYKHDRDGKLLELRVVREDGKEYESFVYNPKNKTIEHTFDSAYGFFGGDFNFEQNKKTSTLDANGNSIEDAYRVRDGATPISRYDGDKYIQSYEPRYKTEKVKHEYELDDHGNWIKRKTFALKDKGPVPTLVTYRTITYYQ